MIDMPLQGPGTEEPGAAARWPLLPPDPWTTPAAPEPADIPVVPPPGAGAVGARGRTARPGRSRPGGRHSLHEGRRSRAGRLLDIVSVGAAAYWNYLLATIAIAVAIPLVLGWYPATVTSDSMQPVIAPGDVVVFDRYDGAPLGAGTIIQFEDPVRPGQTVTHRIVEVLPQGSYVTKGDANATRDSSVIAPAEVIGVAAMLSPNTGLPGYWWSTGRALHFGAWVVLTAGTGMVMMIRRQREPRGSLWPRAVVACMVVAALGGVAVAARTSAAFAGSTDTPGNSFEASASFSLFSHDGVVGVAECAATASSAVSLTAPVPAGNTVVVAVALSDITSSGSPSASDSAGNTYTTYATIENGPDAGAVLLGAHAASALAVGDVVTVTHSAADAVSVSVHSFDGIAATTPVVATASDTGTGNAPSATVTTGEDDTYVIGLVAAKDQNFTIAAPTSTAWSEITNGPVKCSAKAEVTSALHAVPLDAAGSLAYNPTLSKQKRWATVVVAVRG